MFLSNVSCSASGVVGVIFELRLWGVGSAGIRASGFGFFVSRIGPGKTSSV